MTPFVTDALKLSLKSLPYIDAPATKFEKLRDAHCFEISGIMELVGELQKKIFFDKDIDRNLAFLPAPVTVIEYDDPEFKGVHHALMFIEALDGETCEIYFLSQPVLGENGGYVCLLPICKLPLKNSSEVEGGQLIESNFVNQNFYKKWISNERKIEADALAARCREGLLKHPFFKCQRYANSYYYSMLALINSPKIIGRKQHKPSWTLQRKLAAKKAMVGKFPLRAWTEIKLEVNATHIIDGKEVDTHLTGERALHFVRAHVRIQNGILVIVSAHWRGNPALGIVRSRYKVEPPKNRMARAEKSAA